MISVVAHCQRSTIQCKRGELRAADAAWAKNRGRSDVRVAVVTMVVPQVAVLYFLLNLELNINLLVLFSFFILTSR